MNNLRTCLAVEESVIDAVVLGVYINFWESIFAPELERLLATEFNSSCAVITDGMLKYRQQILRDTEEVVKDLEVLRNDEHQRLFLDKIDSHLLIF